MSACPVCSEPKDMPRHIVCPYCWVQVPRADQEEICRLHESAPRSDAYRIKCSATVRDLTRRRADLAATAKP